MIEKNSNEGMPEVWRQAAKAGPECPPLDTLSAWAEDGVSVPSTMQRHLAECVYCRTEIEIIRESLDAVPSISERTSVDWIAQELRKSFPAAAASSTQSEPAPISWRESVASFFSARPMAAWSWAGAAACIFLAATLSFRTGLEPIGELSPYPGTTRSGRIGAIAPTGEVATAPATFSWALTEGASRYEIEVTEIDGTRVWLGSSPTTQVSVSPEVTRAMAPGRTLVWRVRAISADGTRIGESDAITFALPAPTLH